MTEMSMKELQSRLQAAEKEVDEYKVRYRDGFKVIYRGQDESDDICCPVCGNSVARNDDYMEFRPKHCVECGTRLLY